MKNMKQEYQSEITEKRWIVYDILGNIGWITYLICLGLILKNEIDILTILLCVPAVLMLVGIAELISERIAKLDYVLPLYRLYRGFGMLTLGGFLAIFISMIMLLTSNHIIFGWMLASGIMCGVFAGLLLKEYHPTKC